MNTKEVLQQKYAKARNNLLLMLILTVVNIVLYAVGSETMMLFSATVPYFGIIIGSVSGSQAFFMICIFIAVAILIMYLLCWILSKDHYGWMIAALVLFIIDTLAMIGMYVMIGEFSGILDFVIHICVLYYLIVGVSTGNKLKAMPEETITYAEQTITDAEQTSAEQKK